VIEDYINGNLTDAKRGAKRQSWRGLFLALRNDYSKPEREARAVTNYLKGKATFREASSV